MWAFRKLYNKRVSAVNQERRSQVDKMYHLGYQPKRWQLLGCEAWRRKVLKYVSQCRLRKYGVNLKICEPKQFLTLNMSVSMWCQSKQSYLSLSLSLSLSLLHPFQPFCSYKVESYIFYKGILFLSIWYATKWCKRYELLHHTRDPKYLYGHNELF